MSRPHCTRQTIDYVLGTYIDSRRLYTINISTYRKPRLASKTNAQSARDDVHPNTNLIGCGCLSPTLRGPHWPHPDSVAPIRHDRSTSHKQTHTHITNTQRVGIREEWCISSPQSFDACNRLSVDTFTETMLLQGLPGIATVCTCVLLS